MIMAMANNIEMAVAKLHEMHRGHYNELCNVQLDNIDKAGYWFSFDLPQDKRRQTWCVRHSDLEG